jgi:cytochrome oxidase Cu insertion factor (SCO1/SenC/PrrC family)
MNRSVLCLLTAALAITSISAAEFEYAAPVPGSYQLPVIKAAPDGEVLDAQGNTLRLQEVTRGRVTVLSFIYTRCADAKACPYATGVLRELHQASADDPALTSGLRLVSMSFDPEADTPSRLAVYAGIATIEKPAAEWRFLTTASTAKLQPILAGYGQAVDRKKNADDPTGPLNHTLRVCLIDREGRIRNIYSSGTLDVRLVIADVRTLLMEKPLTPGELLGRQARPAPLRPRSRSPRG